MSKRFRKGDTMGLVENEFIKFMEKFDACPFEIILNGEKHLIGEGEPAFPLLSIKYRPSAP